MKNKYYLYIRFVFESKEMSHFILFSTYNKKCYFGDKKIKDCEQNFSVKDIKFQQSTEITEDEFNDYLELETEWIIKNKENFKLKYPELLI